MLGLFFFNPKDLYLPNQFSWGSWQKRLVSIIWCQRRNWVASITELTLIFNPSYVCHDMSNLWPASFVKLPWPCWTEFSQPWKDSRKTFWSHENLRLSGANIGFYSNSREWLNQFINEQKCAFLARCVKSILSLSL